jgi:YidC/Oxa1 family membrane protein insertase
MQLVQKLMLYGAPAGLLISGTFFPLGVLIYWFTNNLWTIGQQFYVLKKMPPPGAPGGKVIDDGKPPVDPKKLAPRPGAKPTKSSARPAAVTSAEPTADIKSADTGPAAPAKPAQTLSATKGANRPKAGNGRSANGVAKPASKAVKPVGPAGKQTESSRPSSPPKAPAGAIRVKRKK